MQAEAAPIKLQSIIHSKVASCSSPLASCQGIVFLAQFVRWLLDILASGINLADIQEVCLQSSHSHNAGVLKQEFPTDVSKEVVASSSSKVPSASEGPGVLPEAINIPLSESQPGPGDVDLLGSSQSQSTNRQEALPPASSFQTDHSGSLGANQLDLMDFKEPSPVSASNLDFGDGTEQTRGVTGRQSPDPASPADLWVEKPDGQSPIVGSDSGQTAQASHAANPPPGQPLSSQMKCFFACHS